MMTSRTRIAFAFTALIAPALSSAGPVLVPGLDAGAINAHPPMETPAEPSVLALDLTGTTPADPLGLGRTGGLGQEGDSMFFPRLGRLPGADAAASDEALQQPVSVPFPAAVWPALVSLAGVGGLCASYNRRRHDAPPWAG